MADTFSFDTMMARLAATKDSPLCVQVGAFDGSTFDPIYKHLTNPKLHMRGLLVEPLPDMYAKLQKTYAGVPGITLEQAAITDKDGPTTMRRLPPEKAAKYGEWASAVSSLSSIEHPQQKEFLNDMVDVPVNGLTMDSLLKKHNVPEKGVDVVVIDAEGYDFQILKQLDFKKYAPSLIKIETHLMPQADRRALGNLLEEHGYRFVYHDKDLECCSPEFYKTLQFDKPPAEFEKYRDWLNDPHELNYAIALLGGGVASLSSKQFSFENVSPHDLANYIDDITSMTNSLRAPNYLETTDSLTRLSHLFKSRAQFREFLTEQMPQLDLRAKITPAVGA